MVTNFSAMNATRDSAPTFITCTFERGRQDYVQSYMKYLSSILPLLLSAVLMVGCAGDFQSTGSGSGATSDSVTSNDSPSVSAPDTSAQDAIERANEQAASDASNAAAQASFIAGMAAAQETMNNANNQAPSN
jgi:hypothetical protein